MINENYLKEVRDQYEMYPYPMRDPEDEKKRLLASTDTYLEHVNHNCFRGKQTFENARILVAGGGTGTAAIFMAEQLRERNAEIVYLDISQASTAIAQQRAKIRGLTNITWVNESILSLPDLEIGKFDYINCVGVLHHLDDPDAGLRALKSVLDPNGAMCIMLYGKYGRTGVYHMQELMRLVNTDEPNMQVKVDNTKTILEQLPPSNWFKMSEGMFHDHKIHGDIGIYDLFLHSQDRGYSVPDLYDLVEGADLNIIAYGPRENFLYRPDTYIRDPAMLQKTGEFDKRKQGAIAELISGAMIKHTVYIAPSADTQASPQDLDNIPFFSFYPLDNLYDAVKNNVGSPVTIQRQDGVTVRFAPNALMCEIIRYIDGNRCLSEIFDLVRQSTSQQALTDEVLLQNFLPVYGIFSGVDWMLLRNKNVPPYKTVAQLQKPISEKYGNA